MRFNVTLDRDEDGIWIVECPSIPGCVSQGQTKEEALENITNLFKELFRGFVDRGIFRTFLDSTTIWYVIPKVSGYPRELCGKFLDNILYGGIRRKFSVFYPLGVHHPEDVGIINSCTACVVQNLAYYATIQKTQSPQI